MKRVAARSTALMMLATVLILISNQLCFGYSVLTHQAIIDITWQNSIVPVILKRYPNLTEEQLRDAHAYAYGGSIIQDMGYYPLSNRFFTDLLHYTRSGDFVQAMLTESRDANEYAFALGALAHYCSDNNGHSVATNRVVPIYYPDLRRKYGDLVTYEQSPSAHIKAEFGFDVVQVAAGNYVSDDYHNFIGFKVSQPLLDRVFFKVYGFQLKDLLANEETAISSYRHTVSKTIPYATKVAWETKKDEIAKVLPNVTRKKFIYGFSRKQFEKEYGRSYSKPTFGQKVVAFFFRLIPKFGPLRGLDFKPATPETEKIFAESIKETVTNYKAMLNQESAGSLKLDNRDFDTGRPTRSGEYRLTDQTYARLLERLSKQDFKNVSIEMKQALLDFYADPNAPNAVKKDQKRWRKLVASLDQLKNYQPEKVASSQ